MYTKLRSGFELTRVGGFNPPQFPCSVHCDPIQPIIFHNSNPGYNVAKLCKLLIDNHIGVEVAFGSPIYQMVVSYWKFGES